MWMGILGKKKLRARKQDRGWRNCKLFGENGSDGMRPRGGGAKEIKRWTKEKHQKHSTS